MSDFSIRQNTEHTLSRQTLSAAAALEKVNAVSERYGLSITHEQAVTLMRERDRALADTGRIEFGTGPLPALAFAFCDSPYSSASDYAALLGELQSLFYAFQNELNGALSDDELIAAMTRLYNGWAGGSLERLAEATPENLFRVANGQPPLDKDEEDEEWMDEE